MKPKLVYVTLLYPSEGGYKNRLGEQLALMSRRFEIHFVYFFREKEGGKSSLSRFFASETRLAPGFGKFVSTRAMVQMLSNPSLSGAEFLAKAACNSALHGVPLFFAPYFTKKARKEVADLAAKKNADAVWAYGIFGAAVAWDAPCRCRVADLCDSISYLYSSLMKNERNPALLAGMATDQQICRRFERAAARHFDATMFANRRDAAWLGLPEGSYCLLPNIRRASKPRAAAKRHDVFLSGIWDYAPNRESLEYSCKKIFPLIKKSARVAVAGRGLDAGAISILHETGKSSPHLKVDVLGEVEDYNREVSSSKAYLLPIWSGAGTSNKVLDALEAGIPALTTPHLKNGMDPCGKCDAIIACKTPQEFASRLEKIISSRSLQAALGRKARAYYLKICRESLAQNMAVLGKVQNCARSKSA